MSQFITEEQYRYVWQSVYKHIQDLATGRLLGGSVFLCHELAAAIARGAPRVNLALDKSEQILHPLLLADGLSLKGEWFPGSHLLHHESSLVKCKARLEWWEKNKAKLCGVKKGNDDASL